MGVLKEIPGRSDRADQTGKSNGMSGVKEEGGCEEVSEDEYEFIEEEVEVEEEYEEEVDEEEEETEEEDIEEEEDVEESEGDKDVVNSRTEGGECAEEADAMEDEEELEDEVEDEDEDGIAEKDGVTLPKEGEECVEEVNAVEDEGEEEDVSSMNGGGSVEEADAMEDEEEVGEMEEEGIVEDVGTLPVERGERVGEANTMEDEEEMEEVEEEVEVEEEEIVEQNEGGEREEEADAEEDGEEVEELEEEVDVEEEVEEEEIVEELTDMEETDEEFEQLAVEVGEVSGKKPSSSDQPNKHGTNSEVHETMGGSGRKRRSGWDIQPGDVQRGGEGPAEVTKRKRSRWDDANIKWYDPLHLPDFTRGLEEGSGESVHLKKLNDELIETNHKLLDPKVSSDDRAELICKKHKLVSKLVKRFSELQPKVYKKLFIPEKEFPDYNFVGVLLGPCAKRLKKMEHEAGAKIMLRGIGSPYQRRRANKLLEGAKKIRAAEPSDDEPLHVLIEADNAKSLDAAVNMVEVLIDPVETKNLRIEPLRELAIERGTLRPKDYCNVCGAKTHSTHNCPLITSDTSDCLSRNNHAQFADGFFSCYSGTQNSGNKPSGIGSDVGSKMGQQKPASNDTQIYVSHIPRDMDEVALTWLFNSFGPINRVKIVRDPVTGVSKHFGFVKFRHPNSAANAIQQMHQFPINGRMLIVRLAGPGQTSTMCENPLMEDTVGKPPAYVGSSVTPQVSPCRPNVPAVMLPPVSCMTYTNHRSISANNATSISHPLSYGQPSATTMLSSSRIMSKMELDSFAGNPDKSATSLFSSFSVHKASEPYSGDCMEPPYQHHVTMSRYSSSSAPINNVPPMDTARFPGNSEHLRTRYPF